VDVNPWLDRFLKIDAEQGRFSMYTELAAADGSFEGYVKPILENPDAGTLVAIVNLLRNAFIAAFSHSLEGTINLRDVDLDADVEPA
jgi:hypothetical protein